jgi:acetyltransferase
MARMSRILATDDRRLTMVVADAWQRRGIGAHLLQAAVEIARSEGVVRLVAEVGPESAGMRQLLAEAGFELEEAEGTAIATRRI